MCGILGVSRMTPITARALPFLAYEMEQRGHDSWGATDGSPEHTHRVLGPVTESWHEYAEDILSWPRAILHTRAASVGAVTVENCHPFDFSSDARRVIGIHNGCISNHVDLDKTYNRNFAVDSMHIFAHLAEGRSTSDIRGWGAVAWYEYSDVLPAGRLHLAKFNMHDCHIALLTTGEIVFASLRSSIERAVRMAGGKIETFYQFESEKLYWIEPKDGDPSQDQLYVRNEKPLPFGYRYSAPAPANTGTGGNGYQRNYGNWDGMNGRGYTNSRGRKTNLHTVGERDRLDNICVKAGCNNKVQSRRSALFCSKHMREYVAEMMRYGFAFNLVPDEEEIIAR